MLLDFLPLAGTKKVFCPWTLLYKSLGYELQYREPGTNYVNISHESITESKTVGYSEHVF